jgi:hypothetical protein
MTTNRRQPKTLLALAILELRRTIAELKEGTLEWPPMIEQMERPMN